jgi:hypothetical protein
MNVKTVLIQIDCPKILKRANNTPTFQRLTRNPLKIGANKERVNHNTIQRYVKAVSIVRN